MARGRQQKWICLDCGASFSVQGVTPKMCCSCGSERIGRAPSPELVENFETKREELKKLCADLNPAYLYFSDLKSQYNELMAYWKQQRRRGYITDEEYAELKALYNGK